MNRQEAIDRLKNEVKRIEEMMENGDCGCVDMDTWNEFAKKAEWRETLIELLSGPTPDSDTGLVPCGCGGAVQLLEDNYCSYWVECAGCGIKLGYWESMDDREPNGSFGKKRDAVKVWNTAMGWRVEG